MDSLLATLQFLPLRLSGNPIGIGIDAVSPDLVAIRTGLLYKLTLSKPEAYGSGKFVEVTTLRGRETQELGAKPWGYPSGNTGAAPARRCHSSAMLA